jgi:hypothetical protein
MYTVRRRLAPAAVVAAALTATLPTIASAQVGGARSGDGFTDSWFWGAKVGAISFSTITVEDRVAPLAGAEWLITRRRGALYLAFDQSLFGATSALDDSLGQRHAVRIRDLRRLTAALVGFPGELGPIPIRPYAGVGLSVNFIRSATPTGDESPDPASDVTARIADQRIRPAFVALAGAQLQVWRLAAFGQASVMPAETRFLLNGRPTLFGEVGVRVNVGSARETY